MESVWAGTPERNAAEAPTLSSPPGLPSPSGSFASAREEASYGTCSSPGASSPSAGETHPREAACGPEPEATSRAGSSADGHRFGGGRPASSSATGEGRGVGRDHVRERVAGGASDSNSSEAARSSRRRRMLLDWLSSAQENPDLSYLEDRAVRPGTARRYKKAIQHFLKYCGEKKLPTVTDSEVDAALRPSSTACTWGGSRRTTRTWSWQASSTRGRSSTSLETRRSPGHGGV